jgi:hypothetical protein
MKHVLWAIAATVGVFVVFLIVLGLIISRVGYGSVESTYHFVTHVLLASILFVTILGTMLIVTELRRGGAKANDGERAQEEQRV